MLALCLLDKGSIEKCKEHTCGFPFLLCFHPTIPLPLDLIWGGKCVCPWERFPYAIACRDKRICAGEKMETPAFSRVLQAGFPDLLTLYACELRSSSWGGRGRSPLSHWPGADAHGRTRQLQVTSPAARPPSPSTPTPSRSCTHCNRSNLKLSVCFTSDTMKCSLAE